MLPGSSSSSSASREKPDGVPSYLKNSYSSPFVNEVICEFLEDVY